MLTLRYGELIESVSKTNEISRLVIIRFYCAQLVLCEAIKMSAVSVTLISKLKTLQIRTV